MATELNKKIAERADWLVDAVATATQNRMFLRGDPACDEIACGAIEANGAKAMRTLLAASQRELEQLELQRQRAVEIALDERTVKEQLQARVDAAEKLIDKWRAVQNPTGAPVYQIYGFCADDLERALSPPAAPVQAEGETK